MGQIVFRFALASIIYAAWCAFTKIFFVYPASIVDLAAFLPPLLGLSLGPAGAVGASMGYLLVNLPQVHLYDCLAVLLAGWLPYKLWHSFGVDKERPLYAFDIKCLGKFMAVEFLTVALTSALVGFSVAAEEIAHIFADANWQVESSLEYAGVLFLNDFDVVVLFGLPLFFILISYGYNFYLPYRDGDFFTSSTKHIYKADRLVLIWLYVFFFILFAILNKSGMIYDLDKMDIWIRFNGEILTMMSVTLLVLIFMLLRYSRSIMTQLMLLEMAAIFIVSFMLGSISFATLSTTVNDYVQDDLQKMSVIYRERLVRSFNEMVMTTSSMARLAEKEIDSYAHLQSDVSYRTRFLSDMERNFTAMAEHSSGAIGCYIGLSEELGGERFLCTRHPEQWGRKLPPFTRDTGGGYETRYLTSREQNMAKLSEPYINSGTGQYMVSYVLPLMKNDKFVGVVGLDIDFDYIIHEIKRMSVYEHGFVRLLDKNGIVLYSSQDQDSTGKLQKFYETEAYLSNGVWLKIAASAHDIYAGRNKMLIHLVVAALFIAVLVTLFSIWMAGRGLRPLMFITSATKKIADGDLEVKIDYKAQNELGTLVQSIKEMAAKLNVYVYHDKLTGVLNSAAYARKTAELKQKDGTYHSQYAVAVFDANFLKRINDNYGHEAGNELITRAAKLISRSFSGAPVYRVGGDEFAAVLEDQAYDTRDKLLQRFDAALPKEHFWVDDHMINVSVARGLAIFQPGESFDEVFNRADAAMYKNKAEIKAKLGITVGNDGR